MAPRRARQHVVEWVLAGIFLFSVIRNARRHPNIQRKYHLPFRLALLKWEAVAVDSFDWRQDGRMVGDLPSRIQHGETMVMADPEMVESSLPTLLEVRMNHWSPMSRRMTRTGLSIETLQAMVSVWRRNEAFGCCCHASVVADTSWVEASARFHRNYPRP